jgi:hypothetical protein
LFCFWIPASRFCGDKFTPAKGGAGMTNKLVAFLQSILRLMLLLLFFQVPAAQNDFKELFGLLTRISHIYPPFVWRIKVSHLIMNLII